MSGQDDRTPLLLVDVEDVNGIGDYKSTQARRSTSSADSAVDESSLDRLIVCVFVVAFDTRAGNLLEWWTPNDVELDGIEFKAMASGCHRVHKDFIYFKHKDMYGVSCFENMPVESEIERGARMKSVGILSTSYFSLYSHMSFLEDQVRFLLENPGKYNKLQDFFKKWKAVLPPSNDVNVIPSNILRPPSSAKVVHPSGCFFQFVKFFGEQIFLLWKCLLLKKRVLFYSPPPIGVVCYRVYCASCLTLHNVPEIMDQIIQPLFYVSVGDVDYLNTQLHYIACTTDKILEGKPHLFDVYIDNQNVKSDLRNLNKFINVTSSDRDKLNKLKNGLRELAESGEENGEEELLFTDYFRDLNTNLFRTLLDVAQSPDRQLTPQLIRSIGLDPFGDRNFLMQMFDVYGIDIVLVTESPCCA